MNCSDWQAMIAAEDPAAQAHLAACQECRAFERELAENAAALREMEIHPAAYAAVRARVLGDVRRKPARWMWPVASTAAILIASSIGLVRWTAPLRSPEPAAPETIAFRVAPPDVVVPKAPERPIANRPQVSNLPHKDERPLTAIKLLTDDPNVVIIWLVDTSKKGDSL